MNYEKSTQRAYWTFNDSSALDAHREAALRAAGAGQVQLLSTGEERGFCVLYVRKIRDWCLNTRHSVLLNKRLETAGPDGGSVPSHFAYALFWTAATLFRRFFLKKSMMASNPLIMRAVAIFVAAKVEELPLSTELRGIYAVELKKLSNFREDSSEDFLIENEIEFLDGVGFHLTVFSPLEPFQGFIEQLERLKPAFSNIWNKISCKGLDFLEHSVCLDLIFLHSPSRLAFGAILAAGEDHKDVFTVHELLQWLIPEGVKPKEDFIAVMMELKDSLKAGPENCNALVDQTRKSEAAKVWLDTWAKVLKSKSGLGKRKRP